MPEPYRKQLDTVPEKEKLNEQRRDYLNSRVLPKFEKLIGVNISKPGDDVPTNNGVPRIFILDEKDPARQGAGRKGAGGIPEGQQGSPGGDHHRRGRFHVQVHRG